MIPFNAACGECRMDRRAVRTWFPRTGGGAPMGYFHVYAPDGDYHVYARTADGAKREVYYKTLGRVETNRMTVVRVR